MNMLWILIVLVLGAVLLYKGIWLIRQPARPRYCEKPVMTENEKEFFWRLYRALPNHFIFPQVSMGALLSATDKDKQRNFADFGRIAQKRVDYAIHDATLNLVCICELDDKTHNAERDAIRDGYFSAAGIETVRWNSRNKPSVEEIANMIMTISGKTIRMPTIPMPEAATTLEGAIQLPDGTSIRPLEHGEIVQLGDLYGNDIKALAVLASKTQCNTWPATYEAKQGKAKFYRRIVLVEN